MREEREDELGKFRAYGIRLSEHLFEKLEKHVMLLRHLDGSTMSKHAWIIQAIQDKLDKEEDLRLSSIPKERSMSIRLPEKLAEQLDKQVDIIGNFRVSFSKKKYIVEAIFEKLEQEEKKAQKLLMSLGEDPQERKK